MTRHLAYVSYSIRKYPWGSIDGELDDIAISFGSDGYNGAGTGFGTRDIDWDFPTAEAAEAFIDTVADWFPEAETAMENVNWEDL
jgi:hypothetical protein